MDGMGHVGTATIIATGSNTATLVMNPSNQGDVIADGNTSYVSVPATNGGQVTDHVFSPVLPSGSCTFAEHHKFLSGPIRTGCGTRCTQIFPLMLLVCSVDTPIHINRSHLLASPCASRPGFCVDWASAIKSS